MTTPKRTLPVLSALLDDLDALATGAKPPPNASKEGDRRVLGIARKEMEAAAKVVRLTRQRFEGFAACPGRPGCLHLQCAIVRALARLDKLTRPTRRTP